MTVAPETSLRGQFLAGGGCWLIDMHGHLGPWARIYLPEAELDSMVAGMARCGVEKIVLSPHSALCGDFREGNDEMLEAVGRYPGRVLGYCTINPNFPAALHGELARCFGVPGVVGVKIHPSLHACDADSPAYAALWEWANAGKRLVLSHTWGAEGCCGTRVMRRVAQRYPEVRLLLGHSCYGAWDEAIALAAEFPNVYLELTAAYHVYGIIERMCAGAGPGKVVYGTDYPWFDPLVAAGCVVYAHIAEEAMHDILHRNARRLLAEQGVG